MAENWPRNPTVALEGGIRRSPLFKDELISTPLPDEPDVNTTYHLMKRSAAKFKDNNFLGWREYKADGTRGDYIWKKYGEAYDEAIEYGAGLKVLCGVESGKAGMDQARVGIYSINRPEASQALTAIWSRRGVVVPLYDSLGANAVSFIVDHASLVTVLVERSKLANLLKGKGAKGTLKNVVLFEEATDEDRAATKAAGLSLYTLSELAQAADKAAGGEEPVPEDWAYVMYTSGTTGDPKGVILSHKNILAAASALMRGTQPPPLTAVDQTDVYISYLPMAHSFEVCIQICLIVAGASIGFFQGDVRKLVTEDLPTLKPTVMAGVPRVYSRVFDKVMMGLESKGRVAKFLFDVAFSNQSWFEVTLGVRNPIWDWILFNTVRQALGGRVRIMCSGAAPLSSDLQKFLKVVFGCHVLQGYGMTENAAAAMAQPYYIPSTGNVGGPLPCCEVKLADTEDYTSADVYPADAAAFEKQVSFKGEFNPALAGKVVPRGEVCLRGHNVFVGYFLNDKETKEVLDDDGWLHTGDIGMWTADGPLCIIDRKKNIFKLAQGEYVAPESVEAAVGTSKWVAQVWVYGSSFETCVVAVIVPDMEVLKPWIRDHSLEGSLNDVLARPEVKKMIYDDIVAVSRASKLRGFEIPKDIAFVTEINELGQGFTIESECLTPTMKLRRPQLLKKYQGLIDACYARVKESEKAAGGSKD